MTNVAAQAIAYPNTMSITSGDGAGGTQLNTLPDYGSLGSPFGTLTGFGGEQMLLALLCAGWSGSCAKSIGTVQPRTAGSGNGFVTAT